MIDRGVVGSCVLGRRFWTDHVGFARRVAMSLLVYFGGCDEYSRRAAQDTRLFARLAELKGLNGSCNRGIETWVAENKNM